jgi:hypothetical protein
MLREQVGEGPSVPDRHRALVLAQRDLPAQRRRGGEPLCQRDRNDDYRQDGGGGEGNGHERCKHRSANLGLCSEPWNGCGRPVETLSANRGSDSL